MALIDIQSQNFQGVTAAARWSLRQAEDLIGPYYGQGGDRLVAIATLASAILLALREEAAE